MSRSRSPRARPSGWSASPEPGSRPSAAPCSAWCRPPRAASNWTASISPARTDQRARGALQAVFQDPYGSLNPARRVGTTLREPLGVHHGLSAAVAGARVAELLGQVQLPTDAADRLPRGFSGGQRQRISIARALATRPRLVVCDEATSALDVLPRESVVDLLARIQDETGVAYLFITHDLPLVAAFADRVIVLYRGQVMESGPARAVREQPLHPYTQALALAVPSLDPDEQQRRREARRAVPATVNATEPPAAGCLFAPPLPPRLGSVLDPTPAHGSRGR